MYEELINRLQEHVEWARANEWEAPLDLADCLTEAIRAIGTYEQTAWERNIAIRQLREDYGVGLGEKKRADVAPVKHGRWIDYVHVWSQDYVQTRCSECGLTNDAKTNYCPYCGAKMDGSTGQTQTNADYIRSMTDEELADWLIYYAHDGYMIPDGGWDTWLKKTRDKE